MDEMLSGFQGIDFPDGYNSRKAKALLKSLMEKIRPGVLKHYPQLRGGRGAGITTFDTAVWDCFGVEPKFTDDLHLTLAIDETQTEISITVPNAATQRWRRLRHILGDPVLRDRFERTLASLRKRVPELWIKVDQRHYIAQRFRVTDARLEFKVDTADFVRPTKTVKRFPLWFQVAQDAVRTKRGINLQLMFQARFPHDKARSPRFADTALRTLKSFKPLYRLLLS